MRPLFLIAVAGLAFVGSACTSTKAWVEPGPPPVAASDLAPNAEPGPVWLLCTFNREGRKNRSFSNRFQTMTKEVLEETGLFSEVRLPKGGQAPPELDPAPVISVVMDNFPSQEKAKASLFSPAAIDVYAVDATFTPPNLTAYRLGYERSIHTRYGKFDPPEGAVVVSREDAFRNMHEEVLLAMLVDLQRAGFLGGRGDKDELPPPPEADPPPF